MKNKIIQIKFTEEEKEMIEATAKEVSLPTASFCRTIIIQNLKSEALTQ